MPATPAKGWSLTARLLVVSIVPALVAVVMAGVITFTLARLTATSSDLNNLRKDVESFARAAPQLVNLSAADRRKVGQLLLRLDSLSLFPLTGSQIDTSAEPALSFVGRLDVSRLEAGETLSGRGRLTTGQVVLFAAHVVFPRAQALTQVVVARQPVPALARLPGGGGGQLLLAGLVATALAVILALFLGRRLGRPLRELSHAAHAVAHGEYGRQVATNVGGEIGGLADDFNAMSGELSAARRREREFVMDVSHDLRTPLTSIRGYAEGLVDGTITKDDDRARAAAVIVGESGRLERLVGDLLSLERLEAGQMRFEFEPVELLGFLQEVLAGRRPAFEASGVGMRAVSAPEVTAVTVTTDPDRFAQVMGNLLDNALRYSPAGSEVGVEVRPALGGGAYVFVADQGTGIAAEDLHRVFERLYVSTKYPGERRAGSGLGLAIVSRIMTALGGTVRVASEPGRGTIFELWLPANPPPATSR